MEEKGEEKGREWYKEKVYWEGKEWRRDGKEREVKSQRVGEQNKR